VLLNADKSILKGSGTRYPKLADMAIEYRTAIYFVE
jgi:hypothetical protein